MFNEYVPKSFPNNLLRKDWINRKIFHRHGSKELFDKIHDFQVREDDIWIVTLPKCGTTWMQEMVWLLMNNCDFVTAKNEPLEIRSPFLEFIDFLGDDIDEYFLNMQKMKSPRIIKSHLPLPLLPKEVWAKKPKLIYVYRNPKDAAVSAYYFRQNFGFYLDKTLAEVVKAELEDEIFTHFQFNHVIEFYELRLEPWIHYTSFERMKKNLRKELLSLSRFLKKTFDDKMIEQMLKHLSFEEMKNNPQCNHLLEIEMIRKKKGNSVEFKDNRFMRKGQIGSHKEEIPPELIMDLDIWIKESLKPYNLTLNDLLLL